MAASPLAESIILAIVFIVFGVIIKFAARRDGDNSAKRNELAVATSVSLMTFGKIFTDLFSAKSLAHEALLPALLGCVAPVLFAISDRYISWESSTGSPAKKKIWLGIVFPNIISVGVLFLYYWLRSNLKNP